MYLHRSPSHATLAVAVIDGILACAKSCGNSALATCNAPRPIMHPELRLIEDFMTDRGTLDLPAQPRMLYVVRGSIAVGRRTISIGEVLYGEERLTAHAGESGATLWRFELSDPRKAAAKMNHPSVTSRDKLARPLATLPQGDLLWRGDSVAFPPGGCAYLHRHQGPGI